MKVYAINPRSRKFYEKPNGSREWHLEEWEIELVSERAIVVAWENFGFNGGRRAWFNGEVGELVWNGEGFELVGLHAEFDEHLGWIS